MRSTETRLGARMIIERSDQTDSFSVQQRFSVV